MNPVSLLPHQNEFINNTEDTKFSALIGGIGSGKTFAGAYKLSKFVSQNPGVNCYYYLPTYPLLRDTAVPSFKGVLDQLGIDYRYHGTNNIFSTKFGQIHLKSYHDLNSLIGYEHGYCIIDEIDTLPTHEASEVFRAIYERNRTRLPNRKANRIDFVSTPEGFKFLYEFFVKNANSDRRYIHAKTDDNTYLPSDFAKGMGVGLTENQLKAHREGLFVNLTSGLVHHAYDREKNHTNREIQPGDTLLMGVDFNILNMSAVFGIWENNRLLILDEMHGLRDTETLCQAVQKRYPNYQIIAHPDSSGINRSTNSNRSDIDILREYFSVKYTRNKSIIDRVNLVNGLFLDSEGNRRLLINSNKTPHLSNCLETQIWKNDKPDKQSSNDHLPDALSYAVVNQNWKTDTTPSRLKYGRISWGLGVRRNFYF